MPYSLLLSNSQKLHTSPEAQHTGGALGFHAGGKCASVQVHDCLKDKSTALPL